MSKQHFEIPEVATGGAAGLPTPQPPQTPEAVEDDRLFASAKAYLMQADADGQSVYDLLYRSVYAMLEENPEEVAAHPERLNEVLSSLKRHQFDGARVPTATARDVREVSKVHPTQTADAKRNLALLAQPKAKSETKIERPSPGVTVTTTTVLQSSGPSFQSVAKDNAMWRFCGHGLPEQEAFLLDQSIARLARDKKLEEVRFVGKIFGLRANYLVVSSRRWIDPSGSEAVYTERYGMPKPPRKNTTVDVQPEPAYKGVNQKSFWVAPEAGAEWVLLPDTTPQNINAARTVNKLFTGDLNAPVVVHPPLPCRRHPRDRARVPPRAALPHRCRDLYFPLRRPRALRARGRRRRGGRGRRAARRGRQAEASPPRQVPPSHRREQRLQPRR